MKRCIIRITHINIKICRCTESVQVHTYMYIIYDMCHVCMIIIETVDGFSSYNIIETTAISIPSPAWLPIYLYVCVYITMTAKPLDRKTHPRVRVVVATVKCIRTIFLTGK